jgi:hypothetical protein
MRARPPSFRSEIAAYRETLRSESPARSRILDRWECDNRTEAIWNVVRSKVPAEYSAQEFIVDVLGSGLTAYLLDGVVFGLPATEAEKLSRIKRLIKSKRYQQAADIMKLLADARALRGRLLSREKETAAQKYFMKFWRDKFRSLCQQPLDEVVAFLTQVVFDIEVSTEAVRGSSKATTRKARKTTRKA